MEDSAGTDKTDFTASYSEEGSKPNKNIFSNAEVLPQQDLNDNVAALIKRNVKESLTNPATGALNERDYYPGIERGINVGSFEGIPQYAAGMPHVPWGVIDARNVARKKAQQEYEQEMLKNLSYDYLETKDKVKQGSLIRQADKLYGGIYQKYTDLAGSPIIGAKMAANSQEMKRAHAELKMIRDKLDENFDIATSGHLQYMHQNVGGASETTTEKEKGKEKGDETTTVEKDVDVAPTKGQVSGYISGYYDRVCTDYLNKTTSGDMSLEEIADLNHNFRTKVLLAQNMDQKISIIGSHLKDNVKQQIMSEAQAGNYAYTTDPKTGQKQLLIHGKLGSDRDNVDIIMTEAGLTEDYLDDVAKREYDKDLASATEAYGADAAKHAIPPLSEYETGLQRYAHQQTKLEMQKTENFDPFRYYHEAGERAEKGFEEIGAKPDIDEISGKEKNYTRLPDNVAKRNAVTITSGQVGTYKDQTTGTITSEPLHGDYMPIAIKEDTEPDENGNLGRSAEIQKMERIPIMTGEGDKARQLYNEDGTPAYQEKGTGPVLTVPYSVVQKTIEADPKLKLTGISGEAKPASTMITKEKNKGKTGTPNKTPQTQTGTTPGTGGLY